MYTPTEKKADSKALKKYVNELEADGVIVRTVPSGSMDCVLKSQLVRLFAHTLADDDEDLVS